MIAITKGGAETEFQKQISSNKKIFLNNLAWICFSLLLIYSIWNLYIRDFTDFAIEFFLVLIIFYCILSLKRDRLNLATNLGSLALIYISLQNFVTGGFSGTGMLWTFLLPSIIFILQGKNNSRYWMGLSYLLIILISASHKFLDYPLLPYTDFMLVNLIIILGIISFIGYYRQGLIEKDQLHLSESISASEKAVATLSKTLDEFKSGKEELEKLNKFMTGREMKMIELKKRIAELEKKNI